MTFARLATNSLFPPEMAKKTPKETRTNKIAHGSKFASPSSPNRIKRTHSITLLLCGNLASRIPCELPLEHLIGALIALVSQLSGTVQNGYLLGSYRIATAP